MILATTELVLPLFTVQRAQRVSVENNLRETFRQLLYRRHCRSNILWNQYLLQSGTVHLHQPSIRLETDINEQFATCMRSRSDRFGYKL